SLGRVSCAVTRDLGLRCVRSTPVARSSLAAGHDAPLEWRAPSFDLDTHQLAFLSGIAGPAPGWGARSRISTSPAMVPLRPSSKVTATSIWARREPSYSASTRGL